MSARALPQARIAGPRDCSPLSALDPRDHPWRPDLADVALADRVVAPIYVRPVPMEARQQVAVLASPDAKATMVSELLPGEGFALLDEAHGHGWGYCLADGYTGYVAREALGEPTAGNSRIGLGGGLLFTGPDIKAPVKDTLPAGAWLATAAADGDFLPVVAGPHAGAFLHRQHLLAGGSADWVTLAQSFVGAPYRWGGRSRAGIDCSGLVQVARQLAGHHCRRDSDMICADAGQVVASDEVQRGDLACWRGHIGIMLDGATILHANAYWMRCVIEPLADVFARQLAAGQPAVPAFRRLTDV